MNSPLPDSSALEAGIIEDSRPSRLSRVQDNVRHLLRSSIIGSVISSPSVSTSEPSPVQTRYFATAWPRPAPEELPSPTDSVSSVASTESAQSTSTTSSQQSTRQLLPHVSYHQAVQHMAHQSALFNTRAIAALNHPDFDATLAAEIREDVRRKQRHAWKRSKRHELRYRVAGSQILLCVLIGLTLAGLLSTYIGLAVTTTQASPVFHILFIMGILLVLIAFVHTVARLVFVPAPRRRRHKTRHRAYNTTTDVERADVRRDHFFPTEPIPVVLQTDDVPLDPNEAQPSTAVHQPPEVWAADPTKNVVQPPPAYGRWRGSVRVNPELIHWQPVQSPGTPTVPSPTYEEHVEGSAGSPPSYRTKESPARTQANNERVPQPEMIEGRGIGLS